MCTSRAGWRNRELAHPFHVIDWCSPRKGKQILTRTPAGGTGTKIELLDGPRTSEYTAPGHRPSTDGRKGEAILRAILYGLRRTNFQVLVTRTTQVSERFDVATRQHGKCSWREKNSMEMKVATTKVCAHIHVNQSSIICGKKGKKRRNHLARHSLRTPAN